jgi:hypothetical protein
MNHKSILPAALSEPHRQALQLLIFNDFQKEAKLEFFTFPSHSWHKRAVITLLLSNTVKYKAAAIGNSFVRLRY